MASSVETVVTEAIAKQANIDPASVRMESTLDELGVTSLDLVEIIMTIEDEYDVKPSPIRVERPRTFAGPLDGDGGKGLDAGLLGLDPGEELVADLERRAPSVGDLSRELSYSDAVCAHPMTRGTLNRPASDAASGALASASVRGSGAAMSSSRSTGRFSTCEVGGTPVVSSALICSTYPRMSPSWRVKRSSSSEVSSRRASSAMRATSARVSVVDIDGSF